MRRPLFLLTRRRAILDKLTARTDQHLAYRCIARSASFDRARGLVDLGIVELARRE